MQFSTLFSALYGFAAVQQISAAVLNVRQFSNTTTAATATTTSTATGTPAPGWTQADVAANCDRWDLIASGDTCQTFVTRYPEITLELLYQWNPSTGQTCNNLWQDYYICTRVVGFGSATSTSSSAVSATVTPTSSAAATAIPAPGPTQPGPAENCNRWDLVPVGASCQTFLSRYPEITIAELIAWNPAIGDTCFIWANYYLCTSVVPVAIAAPGPTQDGVTANCSRWDLVTSGATCNTYIEKYSDITLALLYQWNPAIGSTCDNLWLDYYVCTDSI